MDIVTCKTDSNQSIVEEDSKKELNRDEYPIIWYEPDIDSEEKKTLKLLIQENREINLFAKLEDALKLAHSLGSFLLITPTEEDEKMFQDFGPKEETHCRRYFDFEEEAVLKSLSNEISDDQIKSLKVYVFCTREDFLKEAPINEEEEEVVIKCDIKEMAEQFREEFTIIWCDPDYKQTEKEKSLIKQLDIEEKNIYADFHDLLKNLDAYNGLPYHLILSGKNKPELIIDRIDDFKDLLCVYIYESPPGVVNGKKTRKIEIQKTLEELVPKIIKGIRTKSVYKNTFPAFATQFDDWDKSHINKMHYYLRGFVNFYNRRQAKEDFVSLAKRIHESQKLLKFEREYLEYNKEQILKWYAEESPIYKLINNCLRIATSDSILYCRLILKDMEKAIKEEYRHETKKYSGVVYRGAYISEEEFEKLERNIGKEIEMYGFLSTSKSLKTAQRFVNTDMKNKVLITIIIPPLPLPELDEQGFAEMNKFSEFLKEEEILFNVRSKFQILKVENIQRESSKEYRQIVLLYGAQLLRKYMTSENPTIRLEFKMPLELKCNACESKENLFAYIKETGKTQMICRRCFTSNNLISKRTFLLPIDETIDLPEKRTINIEVQGRMLEFGTEAKVTYLQTSKCQECLKCCEYLFKWINLENKNIILNCLECFKQVQENKGHHLLLYEESSIIFWSTRQGKWEEIEMDWKAGEFGELEVDYGAWSFMKTNDIVKCQEFCHRILQNSVRKSRREAMKVISYLSLASINDKSGEHQKALKYHLKALEIRKSIHGESHPNTSNSYNDLGLVYKSLGEYQKALEYHLKALEIIKSIYGESHSDAASSYNNLGLVYKSLGQHQKALEYFLKDLEIRKFIDGESHPDTATSYNNIATVSHSLGEYQKALEYHLKALEIRKSIYGESHPETAASYNNLAFENIGLGDYQKALEYNLKALEIRKSFYGESHPQIATSYNNLASVYQSLGEYKRALEYFLKALEIRKFIDGESHPNTATLENNLASVYKSLGEYKTALEYHLRALKTRKSIYGEFHPDTANSYNNLASLYFSLDKHKTALEYHLKALEIQKSIYEESHPSIATSYNNLAAVYDSLGEPQKAIEYALKALEIMKFVYGESHSETAISYNILAFVYDNLGEYQKGLECHQKSLKILEFIYGKSHPRVAASYNKLASAYYSLGKHQTALKYHLKALEIRKSVYEHSHPDIADSYNDLAIVYTSLGEHQKALEYHLEALEILKSIYGETHPETAVLYNNLAFVHQGLGEYQKALEYHLKSLEIRKLTYGESHPDTADSYNGLASVYDNLGKHQNSLEYRQKAIKIQKPPS